MSVSQAFLCKSLVSGTVQANGATAVTVSDADILGGSRVMLSLLVSAGTPPATPPTVSLVQAGSFTITSLAGDTSRYSYLCVPPPN